MVGGKSIDVDGVVKVPGVLGKAGHGCGAAVQFKADIATAEDVAGPQRDIRGRQRAAGRGHEVIDELVHDDRVEDQGGVRGRDAARGEAAVPFRAHVLAAFEFEVREGHGGGAGDGDDRDVRVGVDDAIRGAAAGEGEAFVDGERFGVATGREVNDVTGLGGVDGGLDRREIGRDENVGAGTQTIDQEHRATNEQSRD